MTQSSSLTTDLPLPVNQEDVLRLLVLGVAEAPLDVHLSPLLVQLLAATDATSGGCSRRSSDVASAAPEIRRSQHDLHLVPLPLHLNWSS